MGKISMFLREETALLIIDLQERLLPSMQNSSAVIVQTKKLIQAAKILGLPILLTEQYPQGIGPTLAELQALVGKIQPISKRSFSCYKEPHCQAALKALQRRQILICGIETHVCVFQTAADLIASGYQVQVALDAVSSSSAAKHSLGLSRIQAVGGTITCVESALFELLATSDCPEFKPILQLIKPRDNPKNL